MKHGRIDKDTPVAGKSAWPKGARVAGAFATSFLPTVVIYAPLALVSSALTGSAPADRSYFKDAWHDFQDKRADILAE